MDWLPPEIPEWLALVGIGLIGLLLGLLIGRLSKRVSSSAKEHKKLAEKHEGYQQEVTLHFEQTGQLLRTMTEQYKALHDHLALGSADFSDSEHGLFPTLGHDTTAIDAESAAQVEIEDSETESEQDEDDDSYSAPQLPPDVPAPRDAATTPSVGTADKKS